MAAKSGFIICKARGDRVVPRGQQEHRQGLGSVPRTPLSPWEQRTGPEAPRPGEGVWEESGPAKAKRARRWARVCRAAGREEEAGRVPTAGAVHSPHPALGARAPGPAARPCPPCPSLGRGAPTSPACPGPVCRNCSSGGPSRSCCWPPPAGRRPGLTPALGTRLLLLQRPPASVCCPPPAPPPATGTPLPPPLSFLSPVPSFTPLSLSLDPSCLSVWPSGLSGSDTPSLSARPVSLSVACVCPPRAPWPWGSPGPAPR